MTSKAFGLAQLGNAYADGALSNRNLIINGAMRVAQRGTSFTGAQANNYFACDRIRVAGSSITTARFTIEQSTDAPAGFSKSHKVTTTTAEGSVPAEDVFYPAVYRIEGQDLQHLQYSSSTAVPITISFYVKSTETGTYVFSLYNNDNARHIASTYTISAADTWEYKSFTFVGDTTDGFNDDTGIGLELYFIGGAGTDYTSGTLPSSWEDYVGADFAPGQSVQLQNTLNATWQITGVQLEAGDTATPFEHRSYGAELALCQRYFVSTGRMAVIATINNQHLSTTSRVNPVPMRAAPTLSASGTYTFNPFYGSGFFTSSNALVLQSAVPDNFIINFNMGTSTNSGFGDVFNATFSLSAEL